MSEDSLESLSNAELRSKMQQQGLPNIPVTDSSRKVLIKKLRVSMGSPIVAPEKKSNRRETLHVVSKPTQPVHDKEADVKRIANIRRSIATATPTKETRKEAPAVSVTPRRRSSREPVEKPSVVKVSTLSPILIESDDEDDMVIAAEKAEKLSAEKPVVSRPVRAGSISKSNPVTTSYASPKIPLIVEEEREVHAGNYIADIGFDKYMTAPNKGIGFEKYQSEANQSTKAGNLMTESVTVRNTHTPPNRHILNASNYGTPGNYGTPSKSLSNNDVPQLTKRNTMYGDQSNHTSTRPVPYESKISSFRSNLGAYQSEPRDKLKGLNTEQTYTTNYASSAYSPSVYGSSSSSFAVPSTNLYPKLNHPQNEYSDDTDGNNDEYLDSPYLSDFTRNLERLKSEHIQGFTASCGLKAAQLPARRSRRPHLHEESHRPKYNDTIGNRLREILCSLDQKYHVKYIFFMSMVLLLLIFIYVLIYV